MSADVKARDLEIEDSIFRIGKVVSVKGRTVEIAVDKLKNSSHLMYKGNLIRNISVGGYVRIAKGFTSIIGKVNGEFISENKRSTQKVYSSEREKIDRVLEVSLLGFFKGTKFERGIKELPLIDNECYLLQEEEFFQVHNFVGTQDKAITIGTLALEKGQPVSIGINSIFASHIGIFGNTGSGKSYTLAKLYRQLLETYKDSTRFRSSASFFLLDFNGEYVDDEDNIIIDKNRKRIFRLSTSTPNGEDKFPISAESINDPEFWTLFLEATEKTQTPFIRRTLDSTIIGNAVSSNEELKRLIARTLSSIIQEGDKNIDRAIVFNFLKDIRDCLTHDGGFGDLITDYNSQLQYHSVQRKYYYDSTTRVYSDDDQFQQEFIDNKVNDLNPGIEDFSLIEQIRLRLVLGFYRDITRGFSNKEHIAPLIKRLDRRVDDLMKVIEIGDTVDEESPNFTIVSLRDVNIMMRKVLPLLLCKRLYEDKKSLNEPNSYLNLIIDEAHNILSEKSERESEQWRDYRLETFEEMIKEGRKFGVFLTIASQRPSDISSTIISQLHHYFLHRLINNEDIRAVEKTISYLDRVSFETLPILPTGTCIFAGLSANVPVLIDIGKIEPAEHEPKNKTITLVDKWENQ